MQNLTEIPSSEKLKDSRDRLNQNFKSVQSNFSGTSFPTIGLEVGQSCYRTDLGQKYELKSLNPNIWVLSFDSNYNYTNQEYVDENLLLKANLAGAVFTGNVEVNTPVKGTSSKKVANMEALYVGLADKLDISTAQENYCLINDVPSIKVDNAFHADNASTADAFSTPVTISLTGDVTGSVEMSGSNDVAISSTLNFDVASSTFSGSEQSEHDFDTGHPTADGLYDSSNSYPVDVGAREIVGTKYWFETDGAVNEGSYTLKTLLQLLATNAHKHTFRREYYVYDCNCNCDCVGDGT